MRRARREAAGLPLGASVEPLAARPGPPPRSLERNWFRNVLAGEGAAQHFGDDGDWDAAFEGASPEDAAVEDAWRAWRGEVDFAERYVDGAADLEQTGTMRDGQPIPLRDVLVHMIEEYARHCGHADLIRERIDGRVGQ